jgi:hypothetical protein
MALRELVDQLVESPDRAQLGLRVRPLFGLTNPKPSDSIC